MDFRRLEAFYKVYELRSFSKAGKELYLSQPTISAHVASLEAELEVKLFDRLGRSIIPTQAGDVLFSGARKVFRLLEEMESEINLLQDKVVGDLSVGGSTIPAHFILPRLLADFFKMHPQVRVHLTVGDSQSVTEQIMDGRLLIGMVGAEPEQAEIDSFFSVRDELVLIASPSMVEGSDLTLDELVSLPWVMREAGSGTRCSLDVALKKKGVSFSSLNVTAWVESTQAVVQCVKAGMGISVTSRLAAQSAVESGELRIIESVQLDLERSFYLIHRHGRDFSPAARAFVKHIKRNVRPA